MTSKCWTAAAWSTLLLALALDPALGAPAPAETLHRPVVILGLSASPEGELRPAWRQAVERSLLAVAKKTDIILCFEGVPTIKSADLDLFCANPGQQLPRLWWKARSEELEDGRLRAVVELEAGTKAPVGPAQLLLVLQTEIDEEGEELDRLMAQEIESTLADLPDLQRWFGSLRQRPDLVRSWPGREKATPPVAATPRPKIEVQGKGEKPAQPRTEPASFAVREGVVGGGFGVGPAGQLRITPAGIAFFQGDREQWTVRWQELAVARKDEGFWDSPYPIVLIDKRERRRYVSRIDEKGSYLPGDPLLTAISRGRTGKGGTPADAATGQGAGEPRPSRNVKNDQLEQGDIP